PDDVRRRRRRHPGAGQRAARALRPAVRVDQGRQARRSDRAAARAGAGGAPARRDTRRPWPEGGAEPAWLRCRRATAAAAAARRRGHSRAARGAGAFRGNSRMSLLPDNDRILLGPGPSLTAPRVMRAMASPTVSHLDPIMMTLLDDV